jgi:hypothetical protein
MAIDIDSLRAAIQSNLIDSAVDRVLVDFVDEEDAVWVIPAVSSFSEPGAFELYVDALRPRILDAELERFGRGLRERILADHALEGLIDLTVRDEVVFADGDE